MRPVGRRVGVVQLIQGRLVHWSAPWGSSGSSGVAEFIRVRHRGRRVYPWSPDCIGCTLGVVGFVRGRTFHWGAPWGSSCSSGFTGVRRRV